jgi:adenylosuccinate lyase
MPHNLTTAISPLDGRYWEQTIELRPLCSELGLILFRITIEIEWLKALASEPKIKEIKAFSPPTIKFLNDIVAKFTVEDAHSIKELERTTNHDVKAVEYFLKEKFARNKELKPVQQFLHFACTSDDINNLAYAVMLGKIRNEHLLPQLNRIIQTIKELGLKYARVPMLARTHGQPAVPTTVGKEFANFAYRLHRQFTYLLDAPLLAKFNGAVGNFNAHYAAYPDFDWQKFCRKFVEKFGVSWNPLTTQIEPHDYIAEHCDIIARMNTILIGLCRDIWSYISQDYFQQKSKTGEVGSSTMPQKINPIDFENAEGNLGLANALLNFMSEKLPISRLQRDLTDSTVLRNLGVACGHCILAYNSLQKGLNKITINNNVLHDDLNEHWEVLAEAIQTVMRRYGIQDAYEQLKHFARGQKLDQQKIHKFIKSLDIPKVAKQRLLKLTPENYLGIAAELAQI